MDLILVVSPQTAADGHQTSGLSRVLGTSASDQDQKEVKYFHEDPRQGNAITRRPGRNHVNQGRGRRPIALSFSSFIIHTSCTPDLEIVFFFDYSSFHLIVGVPYLNVSHGVQKIAIVALKYSTASCGMRGIKTLLR